MKALLVITLWLFLFVAGDCKAAATAPALQFSWQRTGLFEVEESIQKKGNRMQIIFKCQLSKTNDQFILRWLDAQIVSVNGQRINESDDLKRELAPVQAMFRHPPFSISLDGQFLETIDADEAMKKTNQALDEVAPRRSEESREFFDRFAQSKTGKQMIDHVYGQIWGTWIGMWVGLNVPDGQTVSEDVKVPFGDGDRVPARIKRSNLGPLKSNTNLLSLRFEERLTAKNIGAAINKLSKKVAKETEVKSAEPLPKKVSFERATIVEVHTDRRSLNPHWAKRSVVTTASVPGEGKQSELEVHEYQFRWDVDHQSGAAK